MHSHQIEDMLEEAERQWHASARAVERPLPLVRLRVSYDTQIPLGNLARFGQSFAGRVANPKDVLQLHLLRDRRRSAPGTRSSIVPLDSRMAPAEKLERMDLASLVMEHVRLQQFDLLHPQGLQTSMLGFVEKDERESIADFLDKTVARVEQQLSSQHMQESQLQTALERISAQLGSASTTELPGRPAELPSSQDSMEPEAAVRSSWNEQAPSTRVRPERRTSRLRLDDVSWPDAVEAEPAPPTDTVPVHSTPAERGASRRTRRRLPDGF